MRTLLVKITAPPPDTSVSVSPVSAFPQILLEATQAWEWVTGTDMAQLSAEVERYQPAVIVLVGDLGHSQTWAAACAECFPKLFAMPHPPAPEADLLGAVFARCADIRRRRLAERPPVLPPPPQHAVGFSQLMGNLFPESLRQRARQEARRLVEAYRLQPWMELMSLDGFERGLTLLSLLESQLGSPPELPRAECLAALDVGCHLWSYAPFLQAYLQRFGQSALTGLELDPWYLQADGLTRADWARYWARACGASFLEGGPERQLLPAQDLILLLLPLILPINGLRWGIPPGMHQPHQLLAQLRLLLKPGGRALIYTGVEIEHLALLELLAQLQWPPLRQGPYTCPLRRQPHGFVVVLGNRSF